MIRTVEVSPGGPLAQGDVVICDLCGETSPLLQAACGAKGCGREISDDNRATVRCDGLNPTEDGRLIESERTSE